MAILRNPNRENFTIIANYALKDKNLSLKSRGLLITMLSLPDNWQFSEKGLEKILPKDGQASIRSGLKELEELGYLVRERTRDELGRMSRVEWTILDYPRLENPSVDNPYLENRTQLNTNESSTKGESIKEDIIADDVKSSKPAPQKPVKHRHGQYKNVLLSDAELEKLKQEFPDTWEEKIERLSEYIESKGVSYKSHLATIRMWARKAGEQAQQRPDQKPKFTPEHIQQAKEMGITPEELLELKKRLRE